MPKLRILAEFAAARWMRPLRTRKAVERRQRRLLRRQLRFLRANSPYFAGRIHEDATSLDGLPLMDKPLMMAHFDELNTVSASREEAMALALANERSRDFAHDLGDVAVGLSSGTSGHRGMFLVSKAEREQWAGTVLARALPRGRILGHRVALFLRADNTLYETVASRVVSFRYFDVFGDMDAHMDALTAYRPTILVAPPSILLRLADAAREGRLQGPYPQKVYSVAEVLEVSDARRIATALGQPRIHQIYQCTEGFLAYTCPQGTIHLNEDTLIFEREELGDGRFVPIITDLRRRAQPIVRYRLGDILRRRADPCPCGSALQAIERIEGRTGDTLRLPSVTDPVSTVPVYADLVSRAMVYAEGFRDYRVEQTGPVRIEVALDTDDPSALRSVSAELHALADRMGARRPELVFVPFRHDPATKLRRVMRSWNGGEP